jgi:hypothetical protein
VNSGKFALLLHSIYLLSRVFINISDTSQENISAVRDARAQQLELTIRALIHLCQAGTVCIQNPTIRDLANVGPVSICHRYEIIRGWSLLLTVVLLLQEITVIYSALILLQGYNAFHVHKGEVPSSHYLDTNGVQEHAQAALVQPISECVKICRVFSSGLSASLVTLDQVPLFVLHSTYLAAEKCIHLPEDTDSTRSQEVLQDSLCFLDTKWKAAGM